jgi:aspartyl-tRNA(Asn)/glutamyl-tRNA(Gln) amidotransferase subunit C
MIDRDTVLHVATLSRLELRDDEIEPMARELSAVLDHLETIGELDLEGVEPTAHVLAERSPLRADEPHRSLPREVALDQAPDASDDGFRVPSPQA